MLARASAARNQQSTPHGLAAATTRIPKIDNTPVLSLARYECGTKICWEKGIEYARRLLRAINIRTTLRCMHLDDQELADAQYLVD